MYIKYDSLKIETAKKTLKYVFFAITFLFTLYLNSTYLHIKDFDLKFKMENIGSKFSIGIACYIFTPNNTFSFNIQKIAIYFFLSYRYM